MMFACMHVVSFQTPDYNLHTGGRSRVSVLTTHPISTSHTPTSGFSMSEVLVLFQGVSGLLIITNASPSEQRVRCVHLHSATCVCLAVPSVTIGPSPHRAEPIGRHAQHMNNEATNTTDTVDI